jgi:hypothetical protein
MAVTQVVRTLGQRRGALGIGESGSTCRSPDSIGGAHAQRLCERQMQSPGGPCGFGWMLTSLTNMRLPLSSSRRADPADAATTPEAVHHAVAPALATEGGIKFETAHFAGARSPADLGSSRHDFGRMRHFTHFLDNVDVYMRPR